MNENRTEAIRILRKYFPGCITSPCGTNGTCAKGSDDRKLKHNIESIVMVRGTHLVNRQYESYWSVRIAIYKKHEVAPSRENHRVYHDSKYGPSAHYQNEDPEMALLGALNALQDQVRYDRDELSQIESGLGQTISEVSESLAERTTQAQEG